MVFCLHDAVYMAKKLWCSWKSLKKFTTFGLLICWKITYHKMLFCWILEHFWVLYTKPITLANVKFCLAKYFLQWVIFVLTGLDKSPGWLIVWIKWHFEYFWERAWQILWCNILYLVFINSDNISIWNPLLASNLLTLLTKEQMNV